MNHEPSPMNYAVLQKNIATIATVATSVLYKTLINSTLLKPAATLCNRLISQEIYVWIGDNKLYIRRLKNNKFLLASATEKLTVCHHTVGN